MPPGTPGSVYFSSPVPFEHKGDAAKTQESRSGSLFTMGDVGYLDDEGYLYLCDRRSDLILTGGVNVYPAEVEAALIEHPSVMDCCVIGVPDEEWAERVVAVVEPADPSQDEDALREALNTHARERLARHQAPKQIDFRSDLPRTDTGKLVRRTIRERYLAR